MNKNKSGLIVGIVIAVILIALFTIPRITHPKGETIKKWNDSGIQCIDEVNIPLQEHFHPHLTILVDGKTEPIPSQVGIVPGCVAEIHTHDTSGTIHVESPNAGKKFSLQDFFTVWGQTIERAGYSLEMKVGGSVSQDLGNLDLKDKQEIVLSYSKE